MIRRILLASLVLFSASAAHATSVSCTVTSGTVATSVLGGLGYAISNGIGNITGGATGVISCPAISTAPSLSITNYQVLATVDYGLGPFGTTSGTTVTEVLTLVGGSLSGSSVTAQISGGTSSSGVVPPIPFQIGSTLSGSSTYAAFTVNVNSSVTAGGPVGFSGGQVVVSYDVTSVPLPPSSALLLSGLLALVALGWRQRQACAY
jgi:hypothetical protein